MTIIIQSQSAPYTDSPIAFSELLLRASDIVQDTTNVRWTVAEWLRWANDAARETILRRPAARAMIALFGLVPGAKQTLPDGCIELLDVVRNMDITGTVPGRIIRRVERRLLDDINPDWHALPQATTLKHFSFDERAPRNFYVYPPAKLGTAVEAMYSALPPELTQQTDALDMGAEYINVLVHYMVFRALSKDSEFGDGTIAAAHYQAFVDAVTDNNQTTTANSPNTNHK